MNKRDLLLTFADIKILDKNIPKGFNCELCGHLMKEPIQTYRGCTACSLCYYEALKYSNGKCPIDNEPISLDEIFKDKAKEKEILNLNCCCTNKANGCNWHGSICDLQRHICEYRVDECPLCGEEMMHYEINNHQTAQCPSLVQTGHFYYQHVGCSFESNSKEEMSEHMKANQQTHTALQNNHDNLINLKDKYTTVEKDNRELKETVHTLQQTLLKTQEDTARQIRMLTQSLSQLSNKINDKVLVSGGKNIETSGKTSPVSEPELEKQIREIRNATVNNAANYSDVDLRLQLHENTSNNGHLIWKIDNFLKRSQDAITGKTTALHSAPCLTSQYGYKFCLRVYLNGDGMGIGSHLSLFLVIMKSEYDNILEWPFGKKVKFTLVNQQNRSLDITERMVPNKDSSSFQKPKKEMNIASGCPLFVRLDRLEREGFVKDDSLFIDVQITN